MLGALSQTTISSFLKKESSAGILLICSAALALLLANTGLSVFYEGFLTTHFEVRLGAASIGKPLLLWINDGLMAIFFFLIGLELKREIIEGELSDIRRVMLPAIGALGGMIVPTLIYIYFNHSEPDNMRGWAIPAATDIAFALGILALLGSRVPTSLKVFLTGVAIFDDLGAILIIAFFYTENIAFTALYIVAFAVVVLFILNRRNVDSKSYYIFIGVIMWIAMLKSGVHATLTGVLLAMFIPVKSKTGDSSPLKSMEHDLHSLVAFFILPIFAFANAGIYLGDVSFADLSHPVPIGIALGLIVGKLVGVFSFSYIAVKLKLTSLPAGMNTLSLLGISALCGIGFTMSLFIGSLAFGDASVNLAVDERLGILLGSVVSGILGYVIIAMSLRKLRQ